jgi:hypothetical protein
VLLDLVGAGQAEPHQGSDVLLVVVGEQKDINPG